MAKFITFGRLGLPFATIELMLSNSLKHYPPHTFDNGSIDLELCPYA